MQSSHVQDHVDLIAKQEQEFLARRTAVERVTDSIAHWIGSVTFVTAHLVFFGGWIVWNCLPEANHFDPKPFSLLQACVAMEAIILSSFIVMRQTRLARRSDERDHLMLQILLLSEKEITAMLGLDRSIATEMGLTKEANTPQVRELSKDTSIDEVTQTIKESLEQKQVISDK